MQVLNVEEINEVSGGLTAQCVANWVTAGMISGGAVGFYSGGGVGLGIGVGAGGLGGLLISLVACD